MIIELDMVYILYFRDDFVIGAANVANKIFCFRLVCQQKPNGHQEQLPGQLNTLGL